MASRFGIAVLLVFVCLTAGCKDKTLFEAAPGFYKGFVAVKGGANSRQTLVGAEIKAVSKSALTITVKSLRGNDTWDLTLNAKKGGVVDLSGTELKKEKGSDGCFAQKASVPDSARLCFDRDELTIDLSFPASAERISLVVDRVDDARFPVFELPARYSMDQLIERGVGQNFENRAQFEQVMQANMMAKNASLLLLPHLSANTILGVAFSGFTALYRAVGDLVPFIFPSRWYKRQEAKLEVLVQQDALTLMRADTMNIIAGLGFAIDRDKQVAAKLEKNIASITRIRDLIINKEKDHLLPGGSSYDVTAIINSLEQGQSLLERVLAEEHSALAQAAGFYNPKAVIAVTDTPREMMENATSPADPDEILDVVLQRSYELRQMDTLIDIARVEKKARYVNWLDPAGDSSGVLGFNLFPYFEIGKSRLREMAIKRESLQSLIAQKTYNVIGEIQQSLETHRLAQEGVAIQARRMERILGNFELGLNFSMPELVAALQDQVKADIGLINAKFAYFMAQSKLERLLFAGPYQNPSSQSGT